MCVYHRFHHIRDGFEKYTSGLIILLYYDNDTILWSEWYWRLLSSHLYKQSIHTFCIWRIRFHSIRKMVYFNISTLNCDGCVPRAKAQLEMLIQIICIFRYFPSLLFISYIKDCVISILFKKYHFPGHINMIGNSIHFCISFVTVPEKSTCNIYSLHIANSHAAHTIGSPNSILQKITLQWLR